MSKKAEVLLDHREDISERFRVELKVYKVEQDKKYPEGVKASFVLVDTQRNVARLLIDNHEPYGFHVHTGMPEKMKMKALKIKFEPFDDFLDRSKKKIREAIKTGKPSIQGKDEMVWESVEAFQQFLTTQKFAILAAIYKYKPKSVYELSKILQRAQPNVARDCDSLAGKGFIIFEQEKGSRKKAPRLAFNYNVIVVYLPRVTYKVDFQDVAA